MTKFNHRRASFQHQMECYNGTGEPNDDHPHDINISEFEGTRTMEGSGVSIEKIMNPLKVENVNIGSPENPKFANIGDYQDDETVGNIIELLHEFQYMFPTKFSEMKVIVVDL